MNSKNINYALIFAIILQFVGLIWYVSNLAHKLDTLYTEFEQENKKDVIANQVKMKLDLENLIADVSELTRDLKKMQSKDKEIVKQNKKIEKQHEKLFSLIEGTTTSGYSYGD
jgi:hypothetical protein